MSSNLSKGSQNIPKDVLFRPYQEGDEHKLHWRDENLVKLFSKSIYFWQKYFRYEVDGLEKLLDKSQGALLANNHGLIMFDVLMLAKTLLDSGRAPRALAEHATWKIPVIREICLNMGIVDGTPKNAIRLLKEKELVVVFPGGAREGLKSSAEKYDLYWDSHYGFIKVAIAAGVPIIPCFSAGIDHCYHVFNNGYRLGRKLFDSYVPMPVFAGLGVMPFPVKIKHFIGDPIHHNLSSKSFRDESVVKELHKRVLFEMTQLKKKALQNYAPWDF